MNARISSIDKHNQAWIKISKIGRRLYYNISVISWSSVLLVEETVVPGEKRRPVARHWQTLSYDVVSSAPR
jgi:hypothetical protein